jgi:hypothetical protein
MLHRHIILASFAPQHRSTLVMGFAVACSLAASIGCGPSGTSGSPTTDASTDSSAQPDMASGTDSALASDSVSATDAPPEADAPACDKHLADGFTQVSSSTTDVNLGAQAAMALDENDDPMFAYFDYKTDDATVYFIRWDPCAGAFTAPIVVDAGLGAIVSNPTSRELAIAYDRGTHEIGIAYTKVTPVGPDFAGVTWLATKKPAASAFSLQQISSAPQAISGTSSPNIAMAGGNLYVTYTRANDGCCPAGTCGTCEGIYLHQSLASGGADASGTPHAFSGGMFFGAGDPPRPSTLPHAIAIDSTGTPGVAFVSDPGSSLGGYDRPFFFWRAGMSAPVLVTNSNNVQNDAPTINLAFEGTTPRIAGQLFATASADYDTTYVASTDMGSTWSSPVRLPRDGDESTGLTSALASDGAGTLAYVSSDQSGTGAGSCGKSPYVARSTDHGAHWTPCGADAAMAHAYTVSVVNAAYGKSRLAGTLVIGFQNENLTGETAGIVYWQGK